MLVKFKRDCSVRFTEETNFHSGEFVFMKDHIYEATIFHTHIFIYNCDKSVQVCFALNKCDEIIDILGRVI